MEALKRRWNECDQYYVSAPWNLPNHVHPYPAPRQLTAKDIVFEKTEPQKALWNEYMFRFEDDLFDDLLNVYGPDRHDYVDKMAGMSKRNFYSVQNEFRKFNVKCHRKLVLEPGVLTLKDIENNIWIWSKWWP